MEAGRELDSLVGEKVMGLSVRPSRFIWDAGNYEVVGTEWYVTLPHYSTDIAAAWQVVEKMRQNIEFLNNTDYGDGMFSYTAPEMAEKICLAALKAVGVAETT